MTITVTFTNGTTITVPTTAKTYAADVATWLQNPNVEDAK